MQPKVILRPDRVAVVRHGAAPQILTNIDALSITGGSPVKGDARYTYGVRGPSAVGVVAGGQSRRLDGVVVVLVKGGHEPGADPMADLLGELSSPAIGALVIDDGDIGLNQIESVHPAGQEYVGEIEKYLQDKSKAKREVGGDEFRTFVQMGHNEAVDLHRQAAFTRDVPPSATKALYGTTIGVKQGELPKQVCNWLADSDVETTPVTVTLGLISSFEDIIGTQQGGGTGSPAIVRPYAVVQWGTGGYLVRAEVDIGQGTQFTVAASQILVQVGLENTTTLDIAGAAGSSTPITVTMTGMISFKPIVRTAPLTRTIYVDNQAGIIEVAIPPFAKAVTVYPNNFAVNQNFRLLDSNGNDLWGYWVIPAATFPANANPNFPRAILTGDAAAVSVRQASPGATTSYRFVFELEI